ncbi:MAG: ABC transporter ATP-binding protein [candidate division NC10 bacterium RBG_16_65_8]|nr:MAG: ABC transporter ATP-binding protein [candidate division NC10 bacterium RBG_16_65_8]
MSLLTVEGVSKSFGGLKAVSDASFTLAEGEMLGLIGPNGAGKTTLFHIISGFLRPDEGRVRYAGEDLTGLRPHVICQRGMVRTFQVTRPFHRLTVLENVLVGALERVAHRRQAVKIAEEVLALTGLAEKAGQMGHSLTLPDRKRLELARALATGPRVLLLDEVMAGLNPTETGRLIDLVRAVHRGGITILLIEHVMRVVMALSQRILVLNYGELIAEGSPEAIVQNPKVIEAYLGEGYSGLEEDGAPPRHKGTKGDT